MKIKPIYVLAAGLLFLLVWSWSHWSSTRNRWADSHRKLESCRQIANEIAELRNDIGDSLSTAGSEFRVQDRFVQVLSDHGIQATRNDVRESIHRRDEKLNQTRMLVADPIRHPVTCHQLIQIIHELQTGPVRIVADSIRLSPSNKPQVGEPEKWRLESNWFFYREN